MRRYTRFSRGFAYAMIALLASVTAINYYVFILSNAFAPSGVNGIATMIQYKFNFKISYMSLLVNLPLAGFAFFRIGKEFTIKTMLYVLVFSGILLLFQNRVIDIDRFVYFTPGNGKSTILAPVAAGSINGVIYGLTVRCGGTSGGSDFIAAYVHKKRPDIAFARALFVFNTAVALASFFVYDYNVEPVILSILYTYLTSHISGSIIRGGESAIKIELITPQPEELKNELIAKLRHSVTILSAIGGYTGEPRTMMICVVNTHQIKDFMEIIANYPGTFACVSDVTKTIGNFKRDHP